jgi:hypothetical protein
LELLPLIFVMLIKKGKINWLYISMVAFWAIFVSGINLFLYQELLKELALLKIPIVQKPIVKPIPVPIPMPTEINQNFLAQVNECFIPVAKIYGYTLRITSDFRSLNEQDAIYDLGRTEDGHIVSWAEAGRSIHNYGYAVDVVDRWHDYYINWKRLAKIGEFCGLTQVDDAHFEHRGGLTTEQFNAGRKPAPLTLPCDIMNKRVKTRQLLTLADLRNCGAPNFWNY